MIISRRGIISGLIGIVAAPAVVRASTLMPLRGIILPPSFADPLLGMAITDAQGKVLGSVADFAWRHRNSWRPGLDTVAEYRNATHVAMQINGESHSTDAVLCLLC
jgi:hypothetical protein